MLPIWRRVSADWDHESVFVDRYDQIAVWARQLTGANPEAAEDLIQDAYVHFTSVKLDLAPVRNLDALLYTLVRNLQHSQLRGQHRLRQVPLSILDFNSAELGLKVIDNTSCAGLRRAPAYLPVCVLAKRNLTRASQGVAGNESQLARSMNYVSKTTIAMACAAVWVSERNIYRTPSVAAISAAFP